MTKETAMKILKELHDKSLFAERTALETIIPELKESVDEKTRKGIIELVKQSSEILNKKNQERMLAWLEKQGEQKHINDTDEEIVNAVKDTSVLDLVEQKFKVGDWIVNDYCMGRVVEITNDAYLLDIGQGIPFSCEHNTHLWTIQDAKDGDVLVSKNNQPFIYNGKYNTFLVGAYCGMNCVGESFVLAQEECHWTEREGIKPSSNKQRELLFQKMKEAGYEWDDDKKELKLLITNGGDFEPKQEWSEKDEKIRKALIRFHKSTIDIDGIKGDDIIAWL